MQLAVPVVIMRGGSSRALIFHRHDLPDDLEAQDHVFRSVLGCPDPNGRQADGLGGTSSSTNKVAVIARSADEHADIDFTFAQLAMDRWTVDRASNCGNISAAVGPFAIDEGLIDAVEPVTRVRIRNTNTGKGLVVRVPTRDGKFDPEGACAIAGVPGTGSRIDMDFVDPAGSLTGSLLPTGRAADRLLVGEIGELTVSLVDAGTPIVFVRFADLGLRPDARPEAIDADRGLLDRIESVRAHAAVAMGLASTPAQATSMGPAAPKLVFVDPLPDGTGPPPGLRVLAISMGRAHRSLPLTGAVCTCAAAAIPGTRVRDALPETLTVAENTLELRLAHPAGTMNVSAAITGDPIDGRPAVDRVTVERTARRLIKGVAYVPAHAKKGPDDDE